MIGLMSSIANGDGEEFTDSGEVLRKGMLELDRLVAPLDACFRAEALRVEAHLLVHLPEPRTAPIVGFFSDAGDSTSRFAVVKEGMRGIGWAEVNKDGMAVILVLI
jgi:hypothetical protein